MSDNWKDYPCIFDGRKNTRRWYIKNYGQLPSLIFVCHHCDQPDCRQIKHIFLGTNSDNQIDSVKKKRHAMASPITRLANSLSHKGIPQGPRTREEIIAVSEGKRKHSLETISFIKNSPKTINELVIELGLTYKVIRCIRKGITFRHL